MTKKEEKILQDVDRKYRDSKAELDKRFKDFNEFEDLYWGYIEKDKNAWKSSIFDPESFEKVERVVSHLFATTPKGRVLPRDINTDPKKAPIMDEVVRYQWNKPQQNMHSKLTRLGRGTYIFGTGFGLLEWRYEKQVVMAREGDEYVEKESIIWDDPCFKDLYIYDCYPDPAATSIEDMNYFILNEYVTIDQLRSQNNPKLNMIRYKNIGELERLIEQKREKTDAVSEEYRTRVNDIQGIDSGTLKDRILIRRMFTKNRWYTVAPDYDLVLEDRKNPYSHGELPIHMLLDYEYPNQLYGRGEVDVIRKLQKGLNSVLNQRNDNVRMVMSPALKVKANSRYAHTWKMKPGQKWVMDAMDEIDTFAIPDVTGNTFAQTTNYFKDSMARALGHHDVLTRNPSREGMTATREKLAAGEQNARLRAKEANIDAFIVRLMNQWIQLNQQMITEARVIRITGVSELNEKGVNPLELEEQETYYDMKPTPKLVNGNGHSSLVVEPEDLAGSFDFIVESGSMTAVDPADDFQNSMTALNILQTVGPALMQEGVKVNFRPVIEKMMTKLGIKNLDTIFEVAQEPMGMGEMGLSNPAMANAPLTPDMMDREAMGGLPNTNTGGLI